VSDIPTEAVEAVGNRLLAMVPDIMGQENDMARELLSVAEAAWPHTPPGHDYASTTASSTQRAGARPRPYGRSYKRFGFGPPDVSA
jgi:hypothetical protein